MTALLQLKTNIESRILSILKQQPDWLCHKGCDGCCRRLAAVPFITLAEWESLQTGLAELPEQSLDIIKQNMLALEEQAERPITCPFLDLELGICKVYAYRPIACRTYGFYVERDKGLYCKEIESVQTTGALADVVWGNYDPINHELSKWGESHKLNEWFATLIL